MGDRNTIERWSRAALAPENQGLSGARARHLQMIAEPLSQEFVFIRGDSWIVKPRQACRLIFNHI